LVRRAFGVVVGVIVIDYVVVYVDVSDTVVVILPVDGGCADRDR
jgi:hypothetical protein